MRDHFQQDRVVTGLTERGVKVQSVERGVIKAGQPVVMTMHRAKGTEFSKVVLFGICDGAVPVALRDLDYDRSARADGELRERSLLYVAATRARDLLVVTWSGERSPLLAP